jgi:DNA-binding NtrC family response regulator
VIEIPPLRQRVDEIASLSATFIEEAAREFGRDRVPILSDDARALLEAHPWPGNVRELRHVVERAVLACTGALVTRDLIDLGPIARPSERPPSVVPPRNAPRYAPSGAHPVHGDTSAAQAGRRAPGGEERRRILEALEECRWNQTRAAERLGISLRTLVTRLGEYDIPRPRKRASTSK